MTSRARVLILSARVFVIAFGTAALWLTRDGMNADGIAYLDASDEYLAGRWASGTGYWSPLYPALLAVARLLSSTSPAHAHAVAQAVNLVLFLVAFAAFEWLLRELRLLGPSRDARANQGPATSATEPNDIAWYLLAYAMFAVTTIGWIRLWLLTPDMAVVAVVFASTAVALRLASGRGRWGSAILLGALLAVGYLTKAALLPVGVVVLLTLVVLTRRHGGAGLTAAAAVVFLAISAPQVIYASRLKGSPTFSDVGRLNYLWYVADVPGPVSSAFPLPERLPDPTRHGSLATLSDAVSHPAIYVIDAPIPGTLPIWYDAGYWYRSVDAPIRPVAIARAVVRHVRVYLETFGIILAAALAAVLAGPVSRRAVLGLRPNAVLVVPALAALAMYALVLVQSRYVAPFAVLLVLGLVPPSSVDELSRRLRIGLATGAVAAVLSVIYQLRTDAPFWSGSASARANVVSALQARGIGAGTRLGFIGDAYDALWAHQAGVRFSVLLPRAEARRFWDLDAAARERILDQMRARGAAVILAERPAPGVGTEGWESLPPGGPPGPALMVRADASLLPMTLRQMR